jgi:recombination protein RecA
MTEKKDTPGVAQALQEMVEDSRRRASKARKTSEWKSGEWGIAGRLDELCGAVEEREVTQPVAFDTGIAGLNALLGSGFPVGLTEMYGGESVGKSSLAYQLIAAAQTQGMRAVLCSTQRPHYGLMSRLGVDTKELCLLRAGSLEDAVGAILEEFVPRVGTLFLVLDAATGLRPHLDDPGVWPWVMEGFLTALANGMSPVSAALIINEVRAKKSVDPSKTFAGGTDSAAKRIAGLFPTRLELIRDEVTEGEYALVVHQVASNRRRPQQYVELPARKGRGVDVVLSLVGIASNMGVVKQRGSWLYYEGQRLGQGARAAASFLRADDQEPLLYKLYHQVQTIIAGEG